MRKAKAPIMSSMDTHIVHPGHGIPVRYCDHKELPPEESTVRKHEELPTCHACLTKLFDAYTNKNKYAYTYQHRNLERLLLLYTQGHEL